MGQQPQVQTKSTIISKLLPPTRISVDSTHENTILIFYATQAGIPEDRVLRKNLPTDNAFGVLVVDNDQFGVTTKLQRALHQISKWTMK